MRWGKDPHVTHLFSVVLGDYEVGRFQEVAGMSGKIDMFEIKEGGLNAQVHKFATRASYGDITFKRGFTNDPELFRWWEDVALNSLTPLRNGSIVMYGDNGGEICRWNFFRAFPIKWEGPAFNAMSSTHAIEAMTLQVAWIEFEPSDPNVEDDPVEPPKNDPIEEPEVEPVEDHEGIIKFNRNGTDPGNAEFAAANQAEIEATVDAIVAQIEQNDSATVTIVGHNSNATLSPAEQKWAAEHTTQPRLDNTQAAIEAELAKRDPTLLEKVVYVVKNEGNSQAVEESGGTSSDAGTHNRAVDINVTGP